MSHRRTNHHSTDRVKAAARRDDVRRREPILDDRTADVFPNWHQFNAFRAVVTSMRVPVAKQYALAKQIAEHKDATKKVGAPYIRSKVLEWIEQGMPDVVTDNEKGTGEPPHIIRNEAIRTCSRCAECGNALAPDAPIWRERLWLGQGRDGRPGVHPGMRYVIAPLCEHCRSQSDWRFKPPQPCEGCGRPVHQEDDGRWRERVACCDVCARKARNAAARTERTSDRDSRLCETCDEYFMPPRDDARFCSSVCRQRAYRKRKALGVTNDEIATARPDIISRNAKARAP